MVLNFWALFGPNSTAYIFKKHELHLRICMDYRLVAVDGVLVFGFGITYRFLDSWRPCEVNKDHLGKEKGTSTFSFSKQITLVTPSKKNIP